VSIHYHPSEALLSAYASGALPDGPGLATALHLGACAECRRAVGLFEAVGGALIEDMPDTPLAPQALDLALARIERPPVGRPRAREHIDRRRIGGGRLPAVLAKRRIGRRRFVAPGLWVAHVHSNAPDGWRTYLLHAGQGTRLLQHGHQGPELTTVIHGAFRDETGRYGPGDFVESGDDVNHRPAVDGDEACLCLISAQGGVSVSGLGLLLQPLLQV
jgi:putative transcriptional regulator